MVHSLDPLDEFIGPKCLEAVFERLDFLFELLRFLLGFFQPCNILVQLRNRVLQEVDEFLCFLNFKNHFLKLVLGVVSCYSEVFHLGPHHDSFVLQDTDRSLLFLGLSLPVLDIVLKKPTLFLQVFQGLQTLVVLFFERVHILFPGTNFVLELTFLLLKLGDFSRLAFDLVGEGLNFLVQAIPLSGNLLKFLVDRFLVSLKFLLSEGKLDVLVLDFAGKLFDLPLVLLVLLSVRRNQRSLESVIFTAQPLNFQGGHDILFVG